MAQQPLVVQGLLKIEASRSHSIRQATLGRTPLDELIKAIHQYSFSHIEGLVTSLSTVMSSVFVLLFRELKLSNPGLGPALLTEVYRGLPRPLQCVKELYENLHQYYSHFVILDNLYLYICYFLVWPLLPAHCRCRRYCCTSSHTHTHTRTDTPHPVGHLWMRDRPVTETSTLQRTFVRDTYLWHGRDSNPKSQQASGRKPTPLTARNPERYLE